MKKQIIYTLFFALSGITLSAVAQETMHPSPAQSKTIVISGGTIHVGNGTIIENGTLVLEKGKIKSVIDSEYSLDDAVNAHNKMLNGKGLFGKILIKPNSD